MLKRRLLQRGKIDVGIHIEGKRKALRGRLCPAGDDIEEMIRHERRRKRPHFVIGMGVQATGLKAHAHETQHGVAVVGRFPGIAGPGRNALHGHRLEHKRIVQGIYALLRPLDDEEKLLAVMMGMHLEPGRRRNPVVIEHEQRTERGIAGIEVVVERQKTRHADGAVLFRMTCG